MKRRSIPHPHVVFRGLERRQGCAWCCAMAPAAILRATRTAPDSSPMVSFNFLQVLALFRSKSRDAKADGQFDANTPVDSCIDHRVVPGSVEAAIKPGHAPVEGNFLTGRATTGTGAALYVQGSASRLVEDLPTGVPEAVTPVEVLHV